MGVGYEGVGGVGIEIDHIVLDRLVKAKAFTMEEWETDPHECLSSLGIQYAGAGNSLVGVLRWYFTIKGNTFGEVLANSDEFVNELSKFGVHTSVNDLEIIEDLLIG